MPDRGAAAPRGRVEPSAVARGRVEPTPEPLSRSAGAGPDRNATQRGRIEGPPEMPSRPAPGGDRNGVSRPRIEPPPTPAAGPDWNAPPAPPRALYDAPPPGQDGGRTDEGGNGGGNGWLSNLLTRASREADEPAHGDDRGVFKPSRPTAAKDQRPLPEEDRSPPVGIDSPDALAADIGRLIDHEAAADMWERYNRGERNIFTRRLYTMQGRKAFDEMRKRYKSDREFRQAVDRYVGEFDRLLGEVGHEDGGLALARNYITSEAGKVYTMLAHATGRFD
jgi:hypothetical protein